MRAGWMRPSCSSFSSVMRAISRRTPSKPERITAFGVSSMMKSTPVRCSSARMLRPSRPMMRPFMSSAESWTTDTVVSAAWPAAIRCMTTERMLRTRRSASRLVSSSIWRTRRAQSWRVWSSSSLQQDLLGLRGAQARDALELEHVALARRLRSRPAGSRTPARGGRASCAARRAPPPWRAGAPRGAPSPPRRSLRSALDAAAGDRLGRDGLRGAGAARPGQRGRPAGEQRRGAHQPRGQTQRHHHRCDHDFHCRFLSPLGRPRPSPGSHSFGSARPGSRHRARGRA